jgi:hypothetical protein
MLCHSYTDKRCMNFQHIFPISAEAIVTQRRAYLLMARSNCKSYVALMGGVIC